MPQGDDKFRTQYSEDPQFYSSEFKKYLNSFSGRDFKNADGQYMNAQEKACWDKYKGKSKDGDKQEEDLTFDTSQFAEKDWKNLQSPSYIASFINAFKWEKTSYTTTKFVQTEAPDGSQQTEMVEVAGGNANIWNFVNSVYKETNSILATCLKVSKRADEEYKKIQDKKAREQGAQEKGDDKEFEDMNEKGKKLVVSQEKEGISRVSMIEETREEIQELTGEIERVGREEVLETREEYGMVEPEPEELTNFRSQEEDGLALETDTLEEEMQRIQDINN